MAANRSPVIASMKWQVSGRHFGLHSTPDACTMYYQQDIQGLGEGIYSTQTIPSPPHPYCGCYTMKVFREPKDWDKPKPEARRPRKLSRSEIGQEYDGMTENKIQRQVELANSNAENAYQAWREIQEQT